MEGSSSAHPAYSPWSRCPEDVLEALEAFPEGGAVSSEAERRLKEYRSNRVRGAKSDGPWTIVADQCIARLWHVFDLRTPASGLLRKDRTQNLCLWTALGLCVGLSLAAVCLPGSTDVLL